MIIKMPLSTAMHEACRTRSALVGLGPVAGLPGHRRRCLDRHPGLAAIPGPRFSANRATLPGPGLGAGSAGGIGWDRLRLGDGRSGPAPLFRAELLLGLGPVLLRSAFGSAEALPDGVG